MAKNTKSIQEMLAGQPKVRIMVPGTPGVKAEQDYKCVIINGYTTRIRCGEYVDVPESVAAVLSHSCEAAAKSMRAFADMAKPEGANLTQAAGEPA